MNTVNGIVVAKIFRSNRQRLDRYLRQRGVDSADRDDIIQDTFMRCSRSLIEAQRSPEEIFCFLKVTARNLQIDLYRQRRRHPTISDDDALLSVPEDREARLLSRQKALVSHLLTGLSDDSSARFFKMHYGEELGILEIARLTRTPQGTVASRIQRFRSKFCHSLSAQLATAERTEGI